MSDQNTAAIQALIQQMTTIGERLDGLAKHNERLLDQVMATKKETPKDKPDNLTPDQWAALSKKIADGMKPDTTSDFRKEGDPVQITRSDALDTVKYRQAQQAAQKAAVPLEIVDDRNPDGDKLPPNSVYKEVDTSAIDMLQDDAQKVRYVRQDIAYGGAGYVQNSMAAEREGFKLRTFNDKDDLPQHMQTKLELMARAAVADGAGGNDADA